MKTKYQVTYSSNMDDFTLECDKIAMNADGTLLILSGLYLPVANLNGDDHEVKSVMINYSKVLDIIVMEVLEDDKDLPDNVKSIH